MKRVPEGISKVCTYVYTAWRNTAADDAANPLCRARLRVTSEGAMKSVAGIRRVGHLGLLFENETRRIDRNRTTPLPEEPIRFNDFI